MPIDLRNVLKDLYTQRERLEHVITSLEALQQGSAAGLPFQKRTNRGRKSMSAEERREVSERMRKYWAARRKKKTLAAS
jgi:ethanolamine ammonia-lyase large subunit